MIITLYMDPIGMIGIFIIVIAFLAVMLGGLFL